MQLETIYHDERKDLHVASSSNNPFWLTSKRFTDGFIHLELRLLDEQTINKITHPPRTILTL